MKATNTSTPRVTMAIANQKDDIYCTLLLNDGYLPGAMVLGHSLRSTSTKHKLACLIVANTLQPSTLDALHTLYDYVIPIPRLRTPQPANLYLMNRPDLLYTFTKIALWSLTQFRRIVYLDADVLAIRAPFELFDLPETVTFAAAPDIGWPDLFNTGVMLLTPSASVHAALTTLAASGDSFDGADQGLLNQYYEHRGWERLSFRYNVTPSGGYQYEPAWRYFKSQVVLAHFIGPDKPWSAGSSDKALRTVGGGGGYRELVARWWAVWEQHIGGSPQDYVRTGGQREELPKLHAKAAGSTKAVHFSDKSNAASVQALAPVPTFSAPQMQWDATRGAPPSASAPEASNFPHSVYEFTTSTAQFQPPRSYPEPPKDMWYDVPSTRPRPEQKPAPIFPWETRKDAPPPSRKFIEDDLPPLVTSSSEEGADSPELSGMLDEFSVSADETPPTPTIHVNDTAVVSAAAPWQSFTDRNRNAWDEVSGIDTYVRSLTAFQKRRGNVQVIHQSTDPESSSAIATGDVLSPGLMEPEPAELLDRARGRRESLILTDFPTREERPSLPVTPAPRRRGTFWGDEGGEGRADGMKGMVEAEGVVGQADWVSVSNME